MKKALHGIRIIDFSWAWAGPYATMLAGLAGAEVIRVESRKRLDMLRRHSAVAGVPSMQSDSFHHINLHKESITLDLTRPEAVELVKRLISLSDAVVENFRPGVMERLGLGYPLLREMKPSIVMASLSACGGTGPERHYVGYAMTFGPLSGTSYATGYKDGPPTEFRASMDLGVGTTVFFALLAALRHRQRTGEGQHIDISAREAMSCLVGDIFMDYTMNGRIRPRMGNHDEVMAPHNCYPCQGEDRWVSIAIATEEEWQAFCRAIGEPEWSREERFSDPLSRWENQEELDQLIGEWTRQYTDYEVMELLQRAGVAAMPSLNSQELYTDPHIRERGCFLEMDDPEEGKLVVMGAPWKLSATPPLVQRLGPSLGRHNEYILGELMGLPQREIQQLVEDKVVY